MKTFIPAVVAVWALAACVQVPLSPSALEAKTQFADRNVQVRDIVESRLQDGTMKLAVYGQSISQFEHLVRYRVRWYDAGNAPINTALDNWLEIKVLGNATFDFTAVAPGVRAARYVVEFESN